MPIAIVLALLVLLGGALRFYGLGNESLWFDESCTWLTANQAKLYDVIHRDVSWHLHPPEYFILIHFVIGLFGDSEVVLRFPSAVAGVLLIPAVFLVGCRFYSAQEGLIAAGLTTVLWCPIYFSQEARSYAILLLYVALLTLAWTYWVDAIRARTRPPAWLLVAYFVSAGGASYLHYFGLLFVAILAAGLVYFSLFEQRGIWAIVALHALVAMAYLPWLPTFWMQFTQQAIAHRVPRVGPARAYFEYVFFLFNHSKPLTAIAFALALAWAARAVIDLRRNATNISWRQLAISKDLVLIVWMLLPFGIAYAKSVTSASIYTQRNLLVSMIPWYLIAARGLTSIPIPRTAQNALAALMVGVAAYRLVFVGRYYETPEKDQFREAVGAMLASKNYASDQLIVGNNWNACAFDYNFHRMQSPRRIDLLVTAMEEERSRPGYFDTAIAAIEKSGANRFWLLYSYPTKEDPMLAYLSGHYVAIEHNHFLHTDAFLFEKVRRAGATP